MFFDKDNLIDLIDKKIFKTNNNIQLTLYDKNKNQTPETEIEIFEILLNLLYKNINYESTIEYLEKLNNKFKNIGFKININNTQHNNLNYGSIVFKENKEWSHYLNNLEVDKTIILNSLWNYSCANNFENIWIKINTSNICYINFIKI